MQPTRWEQDRTEDRAMYQYDKNNHRQTTRDFHSKLRRGLAAEHAVVETFKQVGFKRYGISPDDVARARFFGLNSNLSNPWDVTLDMRNGADQGVVLKIEVKVTTSSAGYGTAMAEVIKVNAMRFTEWLHTPPHFIVFVDTHHQVMHLFNGSAFAAYAKKEIELGRIRQAGRTKDWCVHVPVHPTKRAWHLRTNPHEPFIGRIPLALSVDEALDKHWDDIDERIQRGDKVPNTVKNIEGWSAGFSLDLNDWSREDIWDHVEELKHTNYGWKSSL
jgi:hypothetical protein